jgi:hypothetical protein
MQDDRVVVLVAERFRIERACEEAYSDDADKFAAIVNWTSEQIAQLDDEIAGIVATSPAGIVDQVRVLKELGRGVYADDDVFHRADCADRLAVTIAAGIERIAGTDGRAVIAPIP